MADSVWLGAERGGQMTPLARATRTGLSVWLAGLSGLSGPSGWSVLFDQPDRRNRPDEPDLVGRAQSGSKPGHPRGRDGNDYKPIPLTLRRALSPATQRRIVTAVDVWRKQNGTVSFPAGSTRGNFGTGYAPATELTQVLVPDTFSLPRCVEGAECSDQLSGTINSRGFPKRFYTFHSALDSLLVFKQNSDSCVVQRRLLFSNLS